MDNGKIKPFGKNQVNWKILVLIIIVILIGVSMASIQEYRKSFFQRPVPIDQFSETGKSLTNIAEKTLENEGIDTKYILLRSIVKYPSDSTILRFSGTKTFSNAKVYTNHNLTDNEMSAIFAADLSRYDIATYFTKDKQVKVYDKNARVESEIWEYGKNYTLNTTNEALEIIDGRSNKVKLKVLNYMVIQNEEQTNTIANEINKKFELAQQKTPIEFHINREEPIIIIDSTSSKGDLFIEVAFYDSQVSSINIEEMAKESKNGWEGSEVTNKVKYFNMS
ncbi:MAG: hypothetical protein WA144_16455 [Candidatus Methanoperedens sp.]